MVSFFALLLGLQLFQVYLVDTLNYLSRALPAEGLAVFALLTFAIVLALVRLPRNITFIVGGMALLRFAIQFSDTPTRLVFSTLGVILWMWFLSGELQRLRFLPLALFFDTGIRALLWFDQIAFHREWWSYLFAGLLTTLTCIALYRERSQTITVTSDQNEPPLSLLLPFVGLGALLFLGMLSLPNPARLVTSMSELWPYIFIIIMMAVGVILQFVQIPRHWLPCLIAGLGLTGALHALSAGIAPGWLWFALAVTLTIGLGNLLLAQSLPTTETGQWRSSLVVFLSFLIMLVVYFLVEQESVHMMIPITGAILALATGFAVSHAPNITINTGQRERQATIFIVLAGLVSMGIWLAANQPIKVDGTSLKPVFINGQEGYACFRIPSIIRATDGSLLAFAEGRQDNCGDHGGIIRVVMKRSTDNGQTWSSLVVVGENGDNVAASPSPVVDEPTGTILLVFNKTALNEFDVAAGKGVRQFYLTRSQDNGLTWSVPENITESVMRLGEEWRQGVPAVGHAIQLRNGRLFYTAHVSVGGNSVYRSQNYVFWSDDHGQTWEIGDINPEPGYNESMAVEMEDGSVMINARAYADGAPAELRMVAIYPFDEQGKISMKPGYLDPQLVSPTVASSIVRYDWEDNGQGILLFSGPDHPRLRVNMSVRLSYDDGRTWSAPKTIDPGPGAYSDMVVQENGLIGLLYERGNEGGIYYVSFSLDWLKNR